jgi:hypothetical protein
MAKRVADNPAVQARKVITETTEMQLEGGYTVRIAPPDNYDVMIQRSMSQIKDPPVPMVWDEDKEREEPNELDPGYLAAVKQADEDRGMAVMDAMMLFGVELVDGVPEDKRWRRRLELAGIEVDWSDEIETEFAYLKYVVFAGSNNLNQLLGTIGLSQDDIDQAAAMFPGDEERDTD